MLSIYLPKEQTWTHGWSPSTPNPVTSTPSRCSGTTRSSPRSPPRPEAEGFFLLADSASDRVIGLSLWDSAADSEAAGLTFISHMAAVGEHLAAPPSPASFHVAASAVGALGH